MRASNMMPNSRGDLGFIPNSRLHAPNRGFFGSPGHPSKKGVAGLSQVSRMNTFDADVPAVKPGLQSDEMISKRTEWLETQERRLTATISETKSDTNRLSAEMKKNDDSFKSELQSTKDFLQSQSVRLFNEMQQVYGKVNEKLLGLECLDGKCENAMKTYKENPLRESLVDIAGDKEWVLLVYPMVEVTVSDKNTQCFMKCKSVDKETGQLSISWVMVFEKSESDDKKFISEFSLLVK
tara:strand:- start:5325 stop:6038 length:714 start_codon:yes stop_codon:yes gene_type:complete